MFWLRKQKIETIITRILVFCGAISLVVWILMRSDDGQVNYSYISYVVQGLMIGFCSSAVISMLLI